MKESNFTKTLRALKLKAAANVSGVEIIDQKASKRDFVHIWDITGVLYWVIGTAVFLFSVFILYSVVSTESKLSSATTATDIVTLTSSKRLVDVNLHYAIIPPRDAELDVFLPPAANQLQGYYVSIVVATLFAREVLDEDGDFIEDDSTVLVHYGSSTLLLARTEGAMFMVYRGNWVLIRQWITPIQNP